MDQLGINYSLALTFSVPRNLSETTGLLGIQKPHICCTNSCAHHSPPKDMKGKISKIIKLEKLYSP